MKKLYIIIVLLNFFLGFSQDGAPASPYYNGFNWNLSGTALKNALATKIITTHTNLLSYQDAENCIKIIDLDPDDTSNSNVLLVYGFSDNICPTNSSDGIDHRRRDKNSDGTGSCEWNREHTYAKSLGNPDLGTSGPGSDVHHLRASDVSRNSNRGSDKYAFGSGNSGSIGSNWYPGDEWKGDIARMMMYMYLRYGDQCLPKNVGVGATVANDSNMIDLFLNWNAEDPVSELERKRNTYVGNANNTYGQGNRNPFIDNPFLATAIWGGTVAQNNWPSLFLSTPSFDLMSDVAIYPNPTNDNRVNIDSDAVLDEIQLININGQLMQAIKNPKSDNHIYSLENLPTGFYFVKLWSDNQSITRKIIVN